MEDGHAAQSAVSNGAGIAMETWTERELESVSSEDEDGVVVQLEAEADNFQPLMELECESLPDCEPGAPQAAAACSGSTDAGPSDSSGEPDMAVLGLAELTMLEPAVSEAQASALPVELEPENSLLQQQMPFPTLPSTEELEELITIPENVSHPAELQPSLEPAQAEVQVSAPSAEPELVSVAAGVSNQGQANVRGSTGAGDGGSTGAGDGGGDPSGGHHQSQRQGQICTGGAFGGTTTRVAPIACVGVGGGRCAPPEPTSGTAPEPVTAMGEPVMVDTQCSTPLVEQQPAPPPAHGAAAPPEPAALDDPPVASAPVKAPGRPQQLGANAANSLAALRRTYTASDASTDSAQAPSSATATGLGANSLAALHRTYNAGDASTDSVQAPSGAIATGLGAGASERAAGKAEDAVKSMEEDNSGLESEWMEVTARTVELRQQEAIDPGKVMKAKTDEASAPISYREVQQWLLHLPVDENALQAFYDKGMVAQRSCGCFSSQRRMSSVPLLDRKHWNNANHVISLKMTDFDFNDTTHFRMLKTLYTKLTRNKMCPSIGCHWEVLGFQHTDPRTDLNRSGGLLNVLHLFFFLTHHFEILKAAYLLAQDDQQNFPLACVSINMTRMVLEALFAGRLSFLCNRSRGEGQPVFDTTCRVYAGALFHFYSRWRSLKRTIQDTEVTFNEVRALLRRQPGRLLSGLEKGAAEQRAKMDPSRFEFTDLDFGGARGPPQGGAPTGARQPPKGSVPKRLQGYHSAEA